MNFQIKYELYRAYFERILGEACENLPAYPDALADSMRYSLLAGGKRIRPVLFYAALDALGLSFEQEDELALATECIHTYSLIHDDLPAMDNDDFRRGKLSNHKVFGEANAILAGDALLSYALDLILQAAAKSPRHLPAGRVLSQAAGPMGMISGQHADLYFEHVDGSVKDLEFIHVHKTARMIAAPLVMAATLADKYTEEFADFGEKLGLLFQITDDILDEKGAEMGKTLGKDKLAGKLTAVKVYGMERAERLANEYAADCHQILDKLPVDTQFLRGVVDLVLTRNR